MSESSPAVERALASAQELAATREDVVRLADWFLGLLQEEWGRPAELVGKFGLDLERILAEIAAEAASSPVAPDANTLFTKARDSAIALRGESTLTTDFLLLATIAADDSFQARLAELGLEMTAM